MLNFIFESVENEYTYHYYYCADCSYLRQNYYYLWDNVVAVITLQQCNVQYHWYFIDASL